MAIITSAHRVLGASLIVLCAQYTVGLGSDASPGHHMSLEVRDSGSLAHIQSDAQQLHFASDREADEPAIEEAEMARQDDEEDRVHQHDSANKLKDRGSALPHQQQHSDIETSKVSQRSLAEGLRIASHQMKMATQASITGRANMSCIDVLNQANMIINSYYVNLAATDIQVKSGLLGFQKSLFLRGGMTAEALGNLSIALNSIPFWSMLQSGYVWTVEKQYDFSALCQEYVAQGAFLEEYPASSQYTYPALDITHIWQGDMIVENEVVNGVDTAKAVPWNAKYNWAVPAPHNTATVNYCIAPSANRTVVRNALLAAITNIQDQVPCLQFAEIQLDPSDFNCISAPSVWISSNDVGCYSHFGKVSGTSANFLASSQIINLGFGCETLGMVLHQLGHTLGLGHELTRVDRDEFVEFDPTAAAAKSFFPLNNLSTLDQIPMLAFINTPFDFLSVMMPSPFALSSNTSPSFYPKEQYLHMMYSLMGQRAGLSAGDASRLNQLFGCNPDSAPITPTKALVQSFNNGTGFYIDGSCTDVETYGCPGQQNGCFNSPNQKAVQLNCPATCLLCFQAPAAIVKQQLAYELWWNSTNLKKEGATVAISSCSDKARTGLLFPDNTEASCSQLLNYCNHPTMGSAVQTACALTCGCGIRSTNFVTAEAVTGISGGNCKDLIPNAQPNFLIQGVLQDCTQLFTYCSGNSNSAMVVKKCPVTCGYCKGDPIPPPPPPVVKWESSFDLDIITNISASVYGFSGSSGPDTTGNCDRRRRFGFCYSRRRRDVVDIDKANTEAEIQYYLNGVPPEDDHIFR